MHSSKGQVIYLIKMNPIYFGSNCRISEVNKIIDFIKMYFKNKSKKTTQQKKTSGFLKQCNCYFILWKLLIPY